MKRYYTCVLLALLMAGPALAQPVSEQDSLALMTFFNLTDGPNWTNSDNWGTGPVSTWNGVTVAEGRVTELRLNRNQLAGPLPTGIDSLDALEVLSLEGNLLTGTIPPALGNIPNLRFLSLYSNRLEGEIPVALTQLTELTYIRLGINRLTGPVPPEMGQMQKLNFIDFGVNQLTGGIPVELAQLENLSTLYLFTNPLGGTIPPELAQLSNLRVLEIVRADLTGPIPPELGNLENLQIFSFYQNDLTGPIPPELGNLENLRRLYLFDNQLSGAIPEELGALTNLTQIWLQDNQFTGAVPASFANLTLLEDLQLQDNALEDLPDLSAIQTLTKVRFENNLFTFEDLELNVNLADDIVYWPQADFDTPRRVIVSMGDTLTLSYPVGGTQNQYQWLLDDEPLAGANTDTIVLEHNTAASGKYRLEVSNLVVDSLIIRSAPIDVDLVGSTVANETEVLPASALALEAFPNPFRAEATVGFTLPEAQAVTLDLYDLMGRRVAQVLDEVRQAGTHRVGINGADWPAGVYMYRLQTPQGQVTGKLIRMR